MNENILSAAKRIEQAAGGRLDMAIVLGSGLGESTGFMEIESRLPYSEIPGFLKPTIAGHAGEMLLGHAAGLRVAAMRGRFHMYEGHDLSDVVLPVRSLICAGASTVMLTNAAGGVNEGFEPGDLMLISDHINMTGRNPLIGANDPDLGVRFPDMTCAYDAKLRDIARKSAQQLGMTLREGVYAWLTGPSYETPAEIRMLRTMGADAVGMSTVPEVIAARHMGARVMGISCITNMAAGVTGKSLDHAEVTEVGRRAAGDFMRLVRQTIAGIAQAR